MPKNSGIKSEQCRECGIGFMLHKRLYEYTCSYPKCQYSYMIHPVSTPFSRGITVLQESKYKRRRV